MARILIPDRKQELEDVDQIREFLALYGIWYEFWNLDEKLGGRDPASLEDAEIVKAFEPEIERLKANEGYVTADVIHIHSGIPGLDAMVNKFNKEHTHAEDEVRFIVKGRGLFHVRGEKEGEEPVVFAIQVESGDLINVPRGTKHWFDLCEDREIRAIRLFADPEGWVPEYVEEGWHPRYAPLCWGPQYLPADDRGLLS